MRSSGCTGAILLFQVLLASQLLRKRRGLQIARLMRPGSVGFAAALTAAGGALLSLLPVALSVVQHPPGPAAMLPDVPWLAARAAAIALPFSVMFGAATLRATHRTRLIWATAALAGTACLTYLIAAQFAPALEYEVRAHQAPEAVHDRLPFGPDTPSNLTRQRDYVLENPPERYSLSVEDPLSIPPNWLDYRIQVPGVLAALTLLNGLLAWAVACRIRSRPRRQFVWLLWTLGLASAVTFFSVESSAGRAGRRDLSAPGTLYAGAPLLIWVLALVLVRPRRHQATDGMTRP
ncbi:MAG: hypothetical protein Q8P50_12560 [Bacillota bacterium]|nr:hypothetical protein [Bacillota bacterium]